MGLARRHPRISALAVLAVLGLAVELAGEALAARIDVGRHVPSPSYDGAVYYPLLLAGVKVGIALLLTHGAWRFARARATARAARRALGALGSTPPRLAFRLPLRLWAALFGATALSFLAQAGPDSLLHSSALPVFAVLAVLAASLFSAVAGWLAAYETYAEAEAARARHAVADELLAPPGTGVEAIAPPRRLFGVAFEGRPPPVPA